MLYGSPWNRVGIRVKVINNVFWGRTDLKLLPNDANKHRISSSAAQDEEVGYFTYIV